MRLIALILFPLLAAAIIAVVRVRRTTVFAAASALVAGLCTAIALTLLPTILRGEVAHVTIPWAPSLGLTLTLFADGLSLLFALLIAGMGMLVILYAHFYLAEDEALGRFYASLLLFMAAMLGVATAGNLLLLVVFWELTSVTSFLLIGFWDQRPEARAGAYQSLIVTGIGGLALLAGVIILGQAAGTFELSALLARAADIRALPGANTALALILIGAFTKSAQAPFHFWLPSAMAAPTPVSAYLHSATMVKAGIFLLARLSPLFAGTDLWLAAVPTVGATTMLVGGWAALRQTDLKALLAYSTISQLGLITMLLGIGTELAVVAALFHLLNHAVFKAPLFMAAGIVDHETGTRDLRRLGGLRGSMPWTATIMMIGGAAMAGLPPFNGFISKELIYEALLAERARGVGALVWPLLAVVGSGLTVAYVLRLIVGTFFGPRPTFPHAPHEPPIGMRIAPLLLALGGVAIGLVPNVLAAPLIAAASAVRGAPIETHFALWHGWTVALGLSTAAIVGGIVWYMTHLETARALLPPRLGRTAGELYDATVHAMLAAARGLTDLLQTGSLATYVRIVLGVVAVLAFAGWFGTRPEAAYVAPTPNLPGAALITLVLVAATTAVALLYRHRLPSVIALGAVGLLVAIYFAWLSAPDLVMTQLLVETVTTILIILVLYFLPKEAAARERTRRLAADAGFAAVVGLGAGAVVFAILRRPFESISAYHLAHSLADAGGRNVVNVILVDFRGYDTLGEITVLAIAAVGVVALIQAGRRLA